MNILNELKERRREQLARIERLAEELGVVPTEKDAERLTNGKFVSEEQGITLHRKAKALIERGRFPKAQVGIYLGVSTSCMTDLENRYGRIKNPPRSGGTSRRLSPLSLLRCGD